MRKKINSLLILGLYLIVSFYGFSQESIDRIQNYLMEESDRLNLSPADIKDLTLANEHESSVNGLTFHYVQQEFNGVPIYNAISTFATQNDQLFLTGNRFEQNVSERISNDVVQLSPREAIISALLELNLTATWPLNQIDKGMNGPITFFSAESLSSELIPVELLFYPTDDGKLIRVWDLSIYELSQKHWWSVRIDASTGRLIDKVDWVVSCQFETPDEHTAHNLQRMASNDKVLFPAPPPSADQYNVFAIPTESPNHGPRTLVVGPSDAIASPFGWHDDNGIAGVEYTNTRGNNVYAYEDIDDSNLPGYSPDGSTTLNFDFTLDINQPSNTYLDPAITNVFYMTNIMHDVWYQYGFDEVSGNFQQNNYTNGGLSSDFVIAEAQDGSGMDNANFATPPDGENPRMQMYLWSPPGPPGNMFTVNPPSIWQGESTVVEAGFGPGIPTSAITTNLILYEDATPDIYDACEAPLNPAAMNGNIVILRRGSCAEIDKVERAQNAGAAAVIVVDDAPQSPSEMTGIGATITIPAVMINQYNGENLIAEIESGATVSVTLGNLGPYELDGDFDNGIIAHEFGHGISTRLTGGAGSSNCLWNAEQMGEGWSDWFGLMLTIEPGDQATDPRGIGTFASGEPITGNGIRNAPYTTDWAINSFTYGQTNNTNSISQPHGIGFVWATMLWDLNWAMIDVYGFDPDVYYGNGGNNMTMQLVMTGIKLQACSPGFVDGRDAVLAADQLLYGGIHECLIWKVFANRGLGYSADQGSSDDREDQIQAFDLPPGMDHSTTVVACETYTWAENGMTYDTSGVYTSSIIGNGIGCDTLETLILTIGIASEINTVVNVINEITLRADQSGLEYMWVDCNDNYAIIPGEIGQSYYPTENGNYAVIITENLCSDTSACNELSTIGIIENEFGESFMIYPNPTDGLLIIDLGAIYESLKVKVLDMSGKLLSEHKMNDTNRFDIHLDRTAGMYILEILSSDGKQARIRIEKY